MEMRWDRDPCETHRPLAGVYVELVDPFVLFPTELIRNFSRILSYHECCASVADRGTTGPSSPSATDLHLIPAPHWKAMIDCILAKAIGICSDTA